MSEAVTVYLDYSQAELDDAYDQRVWAPNADAIGAQTAAASADVRRLAPHRSDVAYGPGDDERLDIFEAAHGLAPAPIHVHVHGGGWRSTTKEHASFVTRPYAAAGAVSIPLDFSMIPKVRIPEMIEQLRRAFGWIYHNAATFGGDAGRIHLTGHSSGAHLGGVLLTTDWESRGLPAGLIASATLVSGMYDMRPVMLSARRNYVTLADDEVLELSAILHIERIRTPVLLAAGTAESPEFVRQTRDFAAALAAAGKPVRLLEIAGANHFEMGAMLGEPGGALSRATLERMGLGG